MLQLGLGLPDCVNAILVDARAVDALLARLATGYEENDARDLYDLLAQVVLRDRLWLLPTRADLPTLGLMDPWLSNGAALWLPRRRTQLRATDSIGLSGTNVPFRSAEYRQMSRFVQTANAHGLPCYVTGDQARTYEVVGAPQYENALCDLLGQYSAVEQRVSIGMLRRGVSHPHFVNLRIPPLPFEIIRRSKSLEDVIWHTLDLRHDYTKIRRDLAEVSARLADTTVSPASKLRDLSSLERSWKAIHRLADGAIDVPHAKTTGHMSQLLASGAQLGFGLGVFDPGSILGGTIGLGYSVAKIAAPRVNFNRAVWRLQPLGRSVRGCWETSDRTMIGHLQRVFGGPR
jgi:hypothetical protein